MKKFSTKIAVLVSYSVHDNMYGFSCKNFL